MQLTATQMLTKQTLQKRSNDLASKHLFPFAPSPNPEFNPNLCNHLRIPHCVLNFFNHTPTKPSFHCTACDANITNKSGHAAKSAHFNLSSFKGFFRSHTSHDHDLRYPKNFCTFFPAY